MSILIKQHSLHLLLKMQSNKEWDNEITRLRNLVAQKDAEIKQLQNENTFIKSEFNYFIQLVQEAQGIIYGYKLPRILEYDPKIQYTSLCNEPEYKHLFQVLKVMNNYHSF